MDKMNNLAGEAFEIAQVFSQDADDDFRIDAPVASNFEKILQGPSAFVQIIAEIEIIFLLLKAKDRFLLRIHRIYHPAVFHHLTDHFQRGGVQHDHIHRSVQQIFKFCGELQSEFENRCRRQRFVDPDGNVDIAVLAGKPRDKGPEDVSR